MQDVELLGHVRSIYTRDAKGRPLCGWCVRKHRKEHGQLVTKEQQALAARTFSIDVLECSHCGHRPLQVVGVIGAPSSEQLAAALAATPDSAPVKWPRRARAPPVGQMELPFTRAAA